MFETFEAANVVLKNPPDGCETQRSAAATQNACDGVVPSRIQPEHAGAAIAEQTAQPLRTPSEYQRSSSSSQKPPHTLASPPSVRRCVSAHRRHAGDDVTATASWTRGR